MGQAAGQARIVGSRIVTILRRLIALAAVVVGVLGSAASASADAGFEGRVLELVNQERAGHGLAPLAASDELQAAARGYAGAMASGGFFAHNGPDGSTPASRVEAAGYRGWSWVAENIAAGQRSPEQVMSSWMNSPGHRQNLLSPTAREIGIGHVEQGGTKYGHFWVQNFGARANAPMASASRTSTTTRRTATRCRRRPAGCWSGARATTSRRSPTGTAPGSPAPSGSRAG
jgi:uncharacterized protein YkwD